MPLAIRPGRHGKRINRESEDLPFFENVACFVDERCGKHILWIIRDIPGLIFYRSGDFF